MNGPEVDRLDAKEMRFLSQFPDSGNQRFFIWITPTARQFDFPRPGSVAEDLDEHDELSPGWEYDYSRSTVQTGMFEYPQIRALLTCRKSDWIADNPNVLILKDNSDIGKPVAFRPQLGLFVAHLTDRIEVGFVLENLHGFGTKSCFDPLHRGRGMVECLGFQYVLRFGQCLQRRLARQGIQFLS